MKTLYIIGNGFDKNHKLETSYKHFREWLRRPENNKYRDAEDFVAIIEKYIKGVDLWSDFERALGAINSVEYLKDIIDEYKQEQREYDFTGQADAVYAAIEYIIKKQYQELIHAFRIWARDIDTEGVEEVYQGLRNEDHYFFSFNYTDTLENIYGIPDEHIMHIHGYARDKKSEIIVGHNKDYSADRYGIMALIDAELPADVGDSGDKLIEMLNETIKDTKSIINRHSRYFYNLSHQGIEKVIVLGHSYGEVDWPYFEKIRNSCMNAQWELGWFTCDDYLNAKKLCNRLELPRTLFVPTSSNSNDACKCWQAIESIG